MTDLQIFNYEGQEVRTVMVNDTPWWVLADVCRVLDIERTDSTARKLDSDEKGTHLVSTPGGKQNMTIINESGLYNVILRSDKPQAKPFRKWVTCEVLPSIRKTGTYSTKSAAKKSAEELAAISKRAQATLINATQRTADLLTSIWDKAGIKPEYQVLALNDVCANIGIRLPRNALQGVKQTYDKTTIAKMVGVYSKASGGKEPHAHAVGAIISQLDISEDEREALPYCRNGHDGVDYQYTESVVEKVRNWLDEHGYPAPLSVGGKNYNVVYDEVVACPA